MDTHNDTPAPLYLGSGADVDVATTWAQIGRNTLLDLGAHDRLYGRDHVAFTTVGRHRPRRRIIVQLAGDDTYSVGIGYFDRRVFDWVWLATTAGVYCDDLRDRVRGLYRDHG